MKTLELTTEEIRVLRRLLEKAPNHQPYIINAIYISPAQGLRLQADAMEQDERDWPIAQEILRKVNEI